MEVDIGINTRINIRIDIDNALYKSVEAVLNYAIIQKLVRTDSYKIGNEVSRVGNEDIRRMKTKISIWKYHENLN